MNIGIRFDQTHTGILVLIEQDLTDVSDIIEVSHMSDPRFDRVTGKTVMMKSDLFLQLGIGDDG